jgi:hypothetical protein
MTNAPYYYRVVAVDDDGDLIASHMLDSWPNPDRFDSSGHTSATFEAMAHIMDTAAEDRTGPWAKAELQLEFWPDTYPTGTPVVIRTMEPKDD